MIKITNRAQEVGGAPLEMALAARFSKSLAAGRLLMDIRGQITATFRSFAFYRRKYSAHFTATFRTFAFCRRNYSARFTAASAFSSFAAVIPPPTLRRLFALCTVPQMVECRFAENVKTTLQPLLRREEESLAWHPRSAIAARNIQEYDKNSSASW